MDRFSSSVTTNKYSNNRIKPLPTRRNIDSVNKGQDYQSIIISFDRFDDFLNDVRFITNLPVQIVIYDETIPNTVDAHLKRLYVLEKINNMKNIEAVTLRVSDDSLRLYNELMEHIKWRYSHLTKVELTINRNPKKLETIKLEKLQGSINLSQDDLMWLPERIIWSLRGKIKSEDLTAALELKKVVKEFADNLDRKYHLEGLTDFDKMYIAYRLMKSPKGLNIKFAYAQTEYSKYAGHTVLKRSNDGWESNAYGTYQHRQGVCEGQARLFKSLISNPDLGVNCQIISGHIPSGESHAWAGVVVGDKLYQNCLTMRGMFDNLDKAGYKPNPDDVYSQAYPHAYLTKEDQEKIQRHIRSLKK